jgi:predicted nuclease with RNAse H fold
MGAFRTFIGVDLGGGKGKNTAVARLVARTDGAEGVQVADYGTGRDAPWYDDRLISYLLEHAADAVVGIDAPMTLPSCVRCVLPVCPTSDACEVPIIAWFRARQNGTDGVARVAGKKPRYTPYTQRATEVLLHEEHGILPRETLGQGMGPLTARGAYLGRALAGTYELNRNLIEVYPKATLAQLFTSRIAGRYKRSAGSPQTRLQILNALGDLTFAPGAWREDGLANDHKFDAIVCAYTAYLWSRGACVAPTDPTVRDDGWIWFPQKANAPTE